MADQNPQHGRRQHFHRGRRGGPDRRNERRGPGPAQSSEQGPREHREHVDVEQIMREIRSRISQRHGVELTTQQIQELAARRLEAILDPRTVKPSLLEQIRRSTTTPLDTPSPSPEPTYSFEDSTLYESHRGSLRFIRRLLNPLLKLFFNPNPLISALNTQAKLNQAAALREAERERRQSEWNALHYEILQRLVLEVSRTSLEAQQLSMRIDALSAKVDFAERRARSIEGTLHQARPSPRHEPAPPPPQFAQAPREPGAADVAGAPATTQEGVPGEGGRRRRRRRRGRRSQGFTPEGATIGAVAGPAATESRLPEGQEGADLDDADDDEGGPEIGDETESFDDAAPPADLAPPVESIHEDSEPVASPVDVTPAQDTSAIHSSAGSNEPQPPSPDPSLERRVEPAVPEEPNRPQPTEPFATDER